MSTRESQRPIPAIDDEQSFGTSGTTGDPESEDDSAGNGGYPVTAPDSGTTSKTDA